MIYAAVGLYVLGVLNMRSSLTVAAGFVELARPGDKYEVLRDARPVVMWVVALGWPLVAAWSVVRHVWTYPS